MLSICNLADMYYQELKDARELVAAIEVGVVGDLLTQRNNTRRLIESTHVILLFNYNPDYH